MSLSDPRLSSLADLLSVFESWEAFWKQNGGIKNEFLTRECFDDVVCMIMGTLSYVSSKFKLHPFGQVYLHRLNSDVVENIFCSARGICNGANTNPTYYRYRKSINTICIGQPVVSTKSNARHWLYPPAEEL